MNNDNNLKSVDDINLGVKVIEDDKSKVVSLKEASFNKCPKCGSFDIDYDINGIEPEDDFCYRVHRCNKCNTHWDERYDLVVVNIKGKVIKEI